MKAVVDQETCIGCGVCEQKCPAVFAVNDDSLAEVIADPVPLAEEAACREAADACPVEAITIED